MGLHTCRRLFSFTARYFAEIPPNSCFEVGQLYSSRLSVKVLSVLLQRGSYKAKIKNWFCYDSQLVLCLILGRYNFFEMYGLFVMNLEMLIA